MAREEEKVCWVRYLLENSQQYVRSNKVSDEIYLSPLLISLTIDKRKVHFFSKSFIFFGLLFKDSWVYYLNWKNAGQINLRTRRKTKENYLAGILIMIILIKFLDDQCLYLVKT